MTTGRTRSVREGKLEWLTIAILSCVLAFGLLVGPAVPMPVVHSTGNTPGCSHPLDKHAPLPEDQNCCGRCVTALVIAVRLAAEDIPSFHDLTLRVPRGEDIPAAPMLRLDPPVPRTSLT